MRLRLTSFAKRELFRVHDYYERKSKGLGDDILDDVQATLVLIKAYPHAWTAMGKSARRCRLRRFKYGVLYSVDDDTIVVSSSGTYRAGRPSGAS